MVPKNLFTGEQWRNRYRKQTDLWAWERGEEDEMYGKSNGETYITICKIDGRKEFAVMSQETQTGALHQPRGVGWAGRWEGGSKGRGKKKREGEYSIKQLSFN